MPLMQIMGATGEVLVAREAASRKALLEEEVPTGADLGEADLGGANLRGANLGGANLREANLGEANLRGANLRGANLRGANLRGADLREANLRGANLGGANLRGADLWGANLGGANLRGANLQEADLRGANLRGANLQEADLRGADLPTGETWETYQAEVVPQLCTSGGSSLAAVTAAWHCHTWMNCPMAVAFGVTALEAIPRLYRPRVEQFVQLFDAGLLPCPVLSTPPDKE